MGNFAIMHVNSFAYRFFMFNMTKEYVIEFIKDFEPNDEFETIDTNQISLLRKFSLFYFKDLGFYFKPNICNKCYGRCIFSLLSIKGIFYFMGGGGGGE